MTTMTVPRAGATVPAGSRTAIPAVASPIVRRSGVPVRPASAVTTPRADTTVPTASARIAARDGGAGVADAVGVALGVGETLGVADGTGLGLALAGGVGMTVAVGVGVGGGVRIVKSPASVAWIR